MKPSIPGRSKVLGAVMLLVFAGACATLAQPSLPPSIAYSIPRTLKVQVRHGGSSDVVTVPIEDYVAATILSEVDPPDADTKVLERMFEVQAVLTRTYAISHRGRHAAQGFDVCSYDPLPVVRAGPAPRIQMERAGTRSGRADGRPDPLVRRRAGPRRVPRRLRGTHERQQRGLAGRRPHLSAQRRRRWTRARVAHGMDVRGLAGRVAGRAECGSAHTLSDAS